MLKVGGKVRFPSKWDAETLIFIAKACGVREMDAVVMKNMLKVGGTVRILRNKLLRR
jgi:hypothetical protein